MAMWTKYGPLSVNAHRFLAQLINYHNKSWQVIEAEQIQFRDTLLDL